MNVSIEFKNEFVGTIVPTQIHPEEKEFERRIVKLLPENIKSKFDLVNITIDNHVFDKSKSLSENKVKEGAIVVLTIKKK